jgi:hypothetical protein
VSTGSDLIDDRVLLVSTGTGHPPADAEPARTALALAADLRVVTQSARFGAADRDMAEELKAHREGRTPTYRNR